MNQDVSLKLSATRNIIRNKFEKAYANRIEREKDVNLAMKPLTAAHSSAPASSTGKLDIRKEDLSVRHRVKSPSKQSKQHQSLSAKTRHTRFTDSNNLCDRLRLLLTSQLSGNTHHTVGINAIVAKLREQKILA